MSNSPHFNRHPAAMVNRAGDSIKVRASGPFSQVARAPASVNIS
jgi:hypothetical protein